MVPASSRVTEFQRASDKYKSRAVGLDEEYNQKVKVRKMDRQDTRAVDDSMRSNARNHHKTAWFSDIFPDANVERAFQSWCFAQHFPTAKKTMGAVILIHLFASLLDAFYSANSARTYTTTSEWAHWWYLLPALPFTCTPEAQLGSVWKHFWKHIFTITSGVLASGLMVRAAFSAWIWNVEFRNRVLLVLDTAANHSDVLSMKKFGDRNDLYAVDFLTMYLEETNAALLVASATLLMVVVMSLSMTVRTDFINACALAIGCILTLGGVCIFWQVPWSSQAMVMMAVTVLLLLRASRLQDASNRDIYLNARESEFRNLVLEEELCEVEEKLAHEQYLQQERSAVEAVFSPTSKSNSQQADSEGDPTNRTKDLSLRLAPVRVALEEITMEKLIGRGAFGEVIRCTYHGSPVVLKRMLRKKITEKAIREFAAEILLMMKLRHPNIVQFIGATWNTFSNIGFLLEFVERGDLHGILHTDIALSWTDPLCRIATETARGMAYLHGNNVVHRDLKSLNLLISATFGVKICDFGLSKDMQQIEEGTQCGTLLWCAPEVIRGEAFTEAADVFSFGIILSELVTRQSPYHHLNLSKYRIMLLVEAEDLRPEIPDHECTPPLRQLIEECWDSKPQARPSMKQLLSRLVSPEVLEFDAERKWRKMRALIGAGAHLQKSCKANKVLPAPPTNITVQELPAAHDSPLFTSPVHRSESEYDSEDILRTELDDGNIAITESW